MRTAYGSGASWARVATATQAHEALVARGFATQSVRKSTGPRRAAAEHVTTNHGHSAVRAVAELRRGGRAYGHRAEAQRPCARSPNRGAQVRMHGHLREMRGRCRRRRAACPACHAVRTVTGSEHTCPPEATACMDCGGVMPCRQAGAITELRHRGRACGRLAMATGAGEAGADHSTAGSLSPYALAPICSRLASVGGQGRIASAPASA